MIRTAKIFSAGFIGAIGMLFFLDNLFNLDVAHSVVTLILTGGEQPYYKIIGPVVSANWLTWLGLFTIMTGEFTVGVLGFLGMFKLIQNRTASAEDFHAAKAYAIGAGVMGMLVWYGFFVTIGEAYFNMWQTETGLGSVEGAFRYGTVCAVLMFFISSRND